MIARESRAELGSGQHLETMAGAGIDNQLCGHTCGEELTRVVDVLVAEEIEACREHPGGWQTGEVVKPRGHLWSHGGRTAEITLPAERVAITRPDELSDEGVT